MLTSGFLEDVASGAADSIVERAPVCHVPRGTVVDVGGQLLVVVAGIGRLSLTGPDGRQVTVRYVSEGRVAGLGSIGGYRGLDRLEAITDCRFLALSPELVRQLATSEPSVAATIGREIAHELEETLAAVARNSFDSVRRRLAWHLVALHLLRFRGDTIPVSHEFLAATVGTAREVVTRTLRDLRAEGLLETCQAGIRILDLVRLCAIGGTNLGAVGSGAARSAGQRQRGERDSARERVC